MATREELIECATKMQTMMQDPEFGKTFRAKVDEAGILFANQLFDALEEEQIKAIDSWGMAHTGAQMLTHLKMAIKSFPNDEPVKMAVMMLVGVEEKLLDAIQTELAQKHGLPQQGQPGAAAGGQAHGHSHGGQAGAHGHSHGGAQGGQAHGHSHNGVPCTGHGHSHGGRPQMSQQQMAAMQMAMATLSPQQKTDMQGIQQTMMSGRQPSEVEKMKMAGIQQHLAAYMSTMQAAVQGAQQAQVQKGDAKK